MSEYMDRAPEDALRATHYTVGVAVVALEMGRPLHRAAIAAGEGLEYVGPEMSGACLWSADGPLRTTLSDWSDFLALAQTEAMTGYAGEIAEALYEGRDAAEAVPARGGPSERRIEELLGGWRGRHPDVVAYVEEWLDLEDLREGTETILTFRWPEVEEAAGKLALRGSLSGEEVGRAVYGGAWRNGAWHPEWELRRPEQ